MSIGTTTIANNGQVRFGLGALAEITDGLCDLNVRRRPLVCSDHQSQHIAVPEPICDRLFE